MSATAAALAEFLYLRIAEDEASIDMKSVPHASLVQLAPGVQVWHTFGATMPLGEVHGFNPQWIVKPDPKRLHAECEAKRGVVAIASEWRADAGVMILRRLAAPYRNHPDYEAAWRADPGEVSESHSGT